MTLSRIITCQYGKWAFYRLTTIFTNFAAWRKGLDLARRCRPRFPISFSLAESCARGGNWVSLGEGIKQSQISCHWWWQRLCSLLTEHCSAIWWHTWLCSWPTFQFLGFKGSVPNKWWKWGLSHRRWKRKIYFLCVHEVHLAVQFIAEDNAFSQPYGATTLHLKEGRHTWVSSYPFTSFTKGQRLKSNFWRWENFSRKRLLQL